MRTTIFQWWKGKDRTLSELAEVLRYTPDYIYHLAAGDSPVTEGFRARCIAYLGDEVRFLFFDNADTPELAQPTAGVSP